MFCVNCGNKMADESKFCGSCGTSVDGEIAVQPQAKAVEPNQATSSEYIYPSDPPKSPVIAALLSLVFVGVGQFYLGQWQKFVAALALCILLAFTGVLGILASLVWIAMIFDAYFVGSKLAKGTPVKKWQFF